MKWDIVLTIINFIITVISIWFAWRSSQYYKKSKLLTEHTNIDKSLLNVKEMNALISNFLAMLSNKREIRGKNLNKQITDLGVELVKYYNEIYECIPTECNDELKTKEVIDSFHLLTYINSIINCDILIENDERGLIDMDDYSKCQTCLQEMQKYLKLKLEEKQEQLK